MIKHKINERRMLLKSNRHCTAVNKTERIKVLNNDIKSHFNNAKALKVRRSIQPGNTSSVWKAVKTAKDLNTDDLPQTMYEGGIPIFKAALPDQFARFFNSKIVELSNSYQ